MGTGFMTPECETHTVGTTSAKIFDALRRPHNIGYRIVQNASQTATVYLGFGEAAEANKGIVLPPNGTYAFEMYRWKDNLYDGEIYAISSEAGAPVVTLEG